METACNATEPGRGEKTVLVVGVDGIIGSQLAQALSIGGEVVIGTTRRPGSPAPGRIHLDLANAVTLENAPRCAASVLCAAVTSMERCRQYPEGTRLINVINTVQLARRLVDAGSHVVFLSSNTVFDGQSAFARATDPPHPRTEYGRQKADAEAQLLALDGAVTVVRFSKIIPQSVPLLQGWIRDLSAGRIIHPFSDSVMAPLPLAFAVEVLRRVLAARQRGIVQVSATSDISYEQAARHLARRLGCDEALIEPIPCSLMGVAYSPPHTTLDTSGLAGLGLEAPQALRVLDELVLLR